MRRGVADIEPHQARRGTGLANVVAASLANLADRLRGVDSTDQVAFPAGLPLEQLRAALRRAGALFAFVHGSRARDAHQPDADVDVAAWFGRRVASWEVELPAGVDLLVIDTAGLELVGRVAQHGVLLLDDDPPTRVAWQADRRKRYLDEAHRRAELVSTVLGGG